MDVFDLQAKISLDSSEYKKELSGAKASFNELGGKIKAGLATAAKASAAAVGTAAAGIAAITKQSVDAYGSYEQLAGGIDTLFGASAQKVLENSEKAFKTAGMSMNEYMETSIQSAASLINSLGGDQAKAAELMDLSITDMADNVNKMGTTMEGVQNAYRGFSRGNFTMLDNLALGFAGTKEGMQELLDKAHELSGIEYNIDSYADIVQAIHVVQKEMGITGTTAKEAAGTIQGSVGSMKAAWEDLKVNLVRGDGDLNKSIDTLLESALTVFDNIEPKIERAMGGVASFVEKASPIIAEKLPPIVEKILPSLLTTGATLVTAIGKGIAGAMPALINSGKTLLAGIMPEITSTLGLNIDLSGALDRIGGLKDSAGGLLSTIGDIASTGFNEVIKPIAEYSIEEGSELGINVLTAAFSGLKEAIDIVSPIIKPFWDEVLKPMGEWTGGVFADAIERINESMIGMSIIMDSKNLGQLLVNMSKNVDKLDDSVQKCVLAFGMAKIALKNFADETGFKFQWWIKLVEHAIGEAIDTVADFGLEVIRAKDELVDTVTVGFDVISDAWNGFKDNWVTGWNEITDAITGAYDALTGIGDKIGEGIFDFLHDDEGNFSNPFKFFANGGQLTSGQAVIAEAGPELLSVRNGVATVTPLSNNSRNTAVGGGVTVNINMGGVTVSNDYDVDRMTDRAVQQLSEKLAALSVRQQRSVGGVGWNYG